MPADTKRAFVCHPGDNVATLLDDAAAGPVSLIGAPERPPVQATAAIDHAHKIAIAPIAAGQPVVKYGVAIGIAGRDIQAGEWVHLHNCRSQLDERSGKFEGGSEAGWAKKYA
jgi:hypothetical protein